MRSNSDGGSLGHRCNFLSLEKAAAVADIRLGDIDGSEAEQLIEFAALYETFAAGKRNLGLCCDTRHGKRVARREHFFDKHGAARLQRLDIGERGADGCRPCRGSPP